jgi:uncharacterized caspase-like protein
MRAWAVLIALLALMIGCSAQAEQRVALVIGNGTYSSAPALENPTGDAKAMAALLKTVGFDVIEGTNLARTQMIERLAEFGKKADGADLAVFYYAGHAVAVNGASYLVAVDQKVKTELDVTQEAVNLDTVIGQSTRGAHVRLIFFDASRTNPFAAAEPGKGNRRVQTGLAAMNDPTETLIAFASGPGQEALDGPKGGHSPFTQALLENIAAPGVEIQQAMTRVRAEVSELTDRRQLPWGHTYLTGSIYLNPQAPPAGAK